VFCDITQIEVKAGKGGDGCISLLREKFNAKGGPDGGDGGKGGSLFLKANRNLNSLIELHTRKKFAAENGQPGSGSQLHGRDGEDITLEVPVGTIVKDAETDEVLADFSHHDELVEVVKGGRGGYGNEHFKTSIRQTPRFAELGEPGEQKTLSLELQLVADLGIIGLPSAGKSTFISVISAAKPKVAAYHFTTLVPNLGVVKMSDNRSFVACDVPGLIEGAAEGKGLGDEFLRHITRSRILVHLVDISLPNPIEDYKTIRRELEKYSDELAKKPEIILFSKIDVLGGDKELLEMLTKDFEIEIGLTPLPLSSFDKSGLENILEKVWQEIEKEKEKTRAEEEKIESQRVVFQPHLQKEVNPRAWKIEKEVQKGDAYGTPRREGYRITGKRFEQIVVMTDLMNRDAMMRVRDVMYKLGIQKELLRLEVETGTPLFVGEKHFKFEPLLLRK
jgi:GTP-binding protein